MTGNVRIAPSRSGVNIRVPFAIEDGEMSLTWSEANELQFKLRQACIDAGIMVMM